MIRKFSVSNFKCFKDNFTFDLTSQNFSFNIDCIKNNIVNASMIYGYNGCGKSNLGWAIFDIVEHLTDNTIRESKYNHYTNAYNEDTEAHFEYEFLINNCCIIYEYSKTDYRTLVEEKLRINDKLIINFDRRNGGNSFICKLKGTEKLNKTITNNQLSALKYVRKNSELAKDEINDAFNGLFDFVEHMLFFRSLEDRTFIGQNNGTTSLTEEILLQNKLEDFERFLNDANVKCKLVAIDTSDGKKNIAFDFGNKKIGMHEIMSTGTSSLMLFYCWYLHILKKEVSFVFIDEFDAFYHHELSQMVVKKMKDIGVQFILTTHNTSIMSNDILRPDCYFLMNNKRIASLSKCTDKELREVHNIEKIYKANGFIL